MARRILKYELCGTNYPIDMPANAKVLSAVAQRERGPYGSWNHTVYLYALADPNQPIVQRYFAAINTGEYWPEREQYESIFIATVQAEHNVWHIFERGAEIKPCAFPSHNALVEDGRRCPACLGTE